MKTLKKLLFFTGIALVPFVSSAHVKWFVDTDEIVERAHGITTFYSWGSREVLVWAVVVLFTVIIFNLIDSIVKTPKNILSFAIANEKRINRIAQVILGIFLVTVSFIWKIIIVPDIHVDSVFTSILQVIQSVLGVMYIFNIRPKIASTVLIIFCLGLGLKDGLIVILENAILLSLAFYFLVINSNPNSKLFQRFYKHGIEIVRIGTGISLITLAFTEKLIYPELGLQFLSVHHWNFMQSIFPWFTDKLFVLSTGFAEMIFGILFILGYLTRITTILIAIFFAMSVTTMLAQFGAWEVEDLVVYSAAILFLFFGHGRTKFFHFILPNTFLHKPIAGRK